MPTLPGMKYQTELGLQLTAGYMHEGAMLLSDKDYPLFIGDFKPGVNGGLLVKLKLSSLVDFSTTPVWVYQAGTMESHKAVQIPIQLILHGSARSCRPAPGSRHLHRRSVQVQRR